MIFQNRMIDSILSFDATDGTIGYLPETEGKIMAEGITCLSPRTWRYLPGADLLAP